MSVFIICYTTKTSASQGDSVQTVTAIAELRFYLSREGAENNIPRVEANHYGGSLYVVKLEGV